MENRTRIGNIVTDLTRVSLAQVAIPDSGRDAAWEARTLELIRLWGQVRDMTALHRRNAEAMARAAAAARASA
jgi:hypothetical protein